MIVNNYFYFVIIILETTVDCEYDTYLIFKNFLIYNNFVWIYLR